MTKQTLVTKASKNCTFKSESFIITLALANKSRKDETNVKSKKMIMIIIIPQLQLMSRIKITKNQLQYYCPQKKLMLKAIDLGELINPQKICYKTDTVLKNHNPKVAKTPSKLFNPDSCEPQGSTKMILPIKEYSNKFLRESAFKQNERDKYAAKHNRFTPIVNKHKAFQRKYQNMLSRKHYICKTEPNQNEYQCFTTANNFYKSSEQPQVERGRIKTESMIEKHLSRGDLSSYEKEEQKDVLYITPFEDQCVKVKSKQDIPRREEKISTSRALELFSKIISKDKGDLLDRMKSCNQKKLLKDKIMESSKNLEAKQIILLEKQKKYSFVEKGENKVSLKTGLKYRKKKKSNIIELFQQNQKFQICGWDS